MKKIKRTPLAGTMFNAIQATINHVEVVLVPRGLLPHRVGPCRLLTGRILLRVTQYVTFF